MIERPYLRLVQEAVSRPDLRHARRRDAVIYRVRVHLDDSDPTIWRRLNLRSNMTLDLLHQVLQVAFDWTDSHLHRFSLGGGAFDRHSQLFLCPYDVDNKEWPEDYDGLPAADVPPRHATPRHATPRHATPRHATPRHATPRHATPRR